MTRTEAMETLQRHGEVEYPMVACIMLVNGRPDMVKRAAASFLDQTYPRKKLIVWNTGTTPVPLSDTERVSIPPVDAQALAGASIGVLRNYANKYALHHYHMAADQPTLLAHWDSDDWYHPRRLEEQVALMRRTGKQVVGYNRLLFWREPKQDTSTTMTTSTPGEAWEYINLNRAQAVGSSLLYHADAWRAVQFRDLTTPHNGKSAGGEDTLWQQCHRPLAVTAMVEDGPRMIAAIHDDNTSSRIQENIPDWRRAAAWDSHCERVMAL